MEDTDVDLCLPYMDYTGKYTYACICKKKKFPVLNESVTKRTDRALSRETQENSFDN